MGEDTFVNAIGRSGLIELGAGLGVLGAAGEEIEGLLQGVITRIFELLGINGPALAF